MSQLWELLAVMPAALAMCFVLTGVHGYLGLHVLRRKVIFVDLALAQIAALGGITAMALGFDPDHAEEGAHHTLRLFQMLGWPIQAPSDSTMVYAFSLVFALVGAAVFTVSRMRDERIPQEAFIGVTFATAIALALLLLVRVGGGAEQIRNMLARDALLFSTWTDVAKTGALYGSIAIFHFIFWKRFFAISEDHAAAEREGHNLRLWDFFFYASFALVITESVQIAGVLLVFSYLVVPGAIGVLFAKRIRTQVLLAWGTGFGVSAVGLLVCAVDNLHPPGSSPGPWIVAGLATVLALAGVGRTFARSQAKARLILRIVGTTAVLGVLIALAPLLSKVEAQTEQPSEDPILELLKGTQEQQLRAIQELEKAPATKYARPLAELLLADPPDQVVERATDLAVTLGGPELVEALVHTAARPLDATLKIASAEALAGMQDPRALSLMLEVLKSGDLPPFDASDAADAFTRLTGQAVDVESPATLEAAEAWLKKATGTLHFDPASKRFVGEDSAADSKPATSATP